MTALPSLRRPKPRADDAQALRDAMADWEQVLHDRATAWCARWLEDRATAHGMDADHSEHATGAPQIDPAVRRIVADELRDIARDIRATPAPEWRTG